MEYLEKTRTSGFAPNQKVHAIKIYIFPQLNYISDYILILKKF
jgi:hypothetical protein